MRARGPKILIVEPSRTLRQTCAARCRERGLASETADDVVTALAAVVREKPTAVLTSLELPGLSGDALVAALKSSAEHRAIPIALLTSADGARKRFDHYQPERILSKNTDMLAALDGFFDFLGLPKKSEPQRADGLCGRILLAEDGVTNQLILARLLHVAGADVLVVRTGREALEFAAERAFDLVLMDVEMPEMDGREATAELRKRGVRTPILALTGHEELEFESEARSLGFDAVLHKPIDRARLSAACAHWIRAGTLAA